MCDTADASQQQQQQQPQPIQQQVIDATPVLPQRSVYDRIWAGCYQCCEVFDVCCCSGQNRDCRGEE